jgi:hypothetical protein
MEDLSMEVEMTNMYVQEYILKIIRNAENCNGYLQKWDTDIGQQEQRKNRSSRNKNLRWLVGY